MQSEKGVIDRGNYSVLMSVYEKEQAECLDKAIRSMFSQTVPTDDFVLVCDGPLTPRLEQVISSYQSKYSSRFHVVRLPENKGLAAALNEGLRHCRHELVARMDSDDISLPERCALQLAAFSKDDTLAFCSGSIMEFTHTTGAAVRPQDMTACRRLPLTHEEIVTFAKHRNPMNHMAVMFQKSRVLAAGGYIDIGGAEDYCLWVRMIQKGFRASNLESVLVYARVGNGMMKRRGGLHYAKESLRLQNFFLNSGFLTFGEYLENCVVRVLVSLMPEGLRSHFYKKHLRNGNKEQRAQ